MASVCMGWGLAVLDPPRFAGKSGTVWTFFDIFLCGYSSVETGLLEKQLTLPGTVSRWPVVARCKLLRLGPERNFPCGAYTTVLF